MSRRSLWARLRGARRRRDEPGGGPPAAKRGLAAVMFADMVGYTALMGRDEAAARDRRNRQRAVVDDLVRRHGGQVRQHYGDGTLAVFPSAVEAAWCALGIQEELRKEPAVPVRIGLHTGDIVDEGDGIYGDGVNLASRVQGVAESGGVAVSDKFRDEIRNQRGIDATSLGAHELKNVDRAVEIFSITASAPRERVPPPRPPESDEAWLPSGRAPLLKAGAAALLVASVVALLWTSSRAGTDTRGGVASASALPSIAVLPFRNLSAAEENAAFFADGLHDDILTQLAKLGALQVIARTSVMRYAGSTSTVPEIGRELGVDVVLEGGVQRAGDNIRLNVQLIDAESDAHLWADTYDRALTTENVFAIQSEVAQAIAGALRAVLSGDERTALAAVPTGSMDAYDHYLRGSMALRELGGFADLTEAENEFAEAVRIDPTFAAAHARLSYTHLNMYWNAYDRTEERRALARQALERAEALDPDDPEVLIARGYYRYWGSRDYPAASIAFGQALRARPGDARVHEARAYVLRRSGSWIEALRDLETAVGLDPMNSELVRALGQTHLHMRDYDGAEELLDRALTLQPDRWSTLYDRALLDLMRDGDLTRLRIPVRNLQAAREFTFVRWWLAFVDGDEATAFAVSSALTAAVEQQAAVNPPSLLNALLHWRMGRTAEARAAADTAAVVLEAMLAERPDDPRIHSALGHALALRGDREQAVEEGMEAVRLLPISSDAMDGPEYLLQLAEIYGLLGEAEPALDALYRALSVPNGNSLASVLVSPLAAPLRGHPGLAAIAEAERMPELRDRL